MAPETYWQLRYLQAEAEKAACVTALAEARYREALRAAGVDPTVPYRWDDARADVIPIREDRCDG